MNINILKTSALVIGSGCAGLNAADWLMALGVKDAMLLTEDIAGGTSRNAGSDKQTYYKLSLAGPKGDSVIELARDLYSGGGVHGDIALIEAAGSARAFYRLCELGVPFPSDEYGQFPGYKTDHDPRGRATSAGPLTSKMMAECLERSARQKGASIRSGLTVVKLILVAGRVAGALAIDRENLANDSFGLTAIQSPNIILATGGPAICYRDSVYPIGQTGMTGTALMAGAAGANLDRWQYGLASVKFRWNVSGTYQQALPRYISVGQDGGVREFLLDEFENPADALMRVFLKGYQWPFDPDKIEGSSRIDLLVHREIFERGRKVYLDFTRDPKGLAADFSNLPAEAKNYLDNSGALIPTPIARLRRMNPEAIALYQAHGIDITREPLEIAVCAQHHNGGLAVDANWQSTLPGLYAAGEAAGTFGARRPGGSALNSGQVGSFRAASQIARTLRADQGKAIGGAEFQKIANQAAEDLSLRFRSALSRGGEASYPAQRDYFQSAMSGCAAQSRDIREMAALADEIGRAITSFWEDARAGSREDLIELMKNYDMLAAQRAALSAMLERLTNESALIETHVSASAARSSQAPARPLPENDLWFENVWRDYRARNARPK